LPRKKGRGRGREGKRGGTKGCSTITVHLREGGEGSKNPLKTKAKNRQVNRSREKEG